MVHVQAGTTSLVCRTVSLAIAERGKDLGTLQRHNEPPVSLREPHTTQPFVIVLCESWTRCSSFDHYKSLKNGFYPRKGSMATFTRPRAKFWKYLKYVFALTRQEILLATHLP